MFNHTQIILTHTVITPYCISCILLPLFHLLIPPPPSTHPQKAGAEAHAMLAVAEVHTMLAAAEVHAMLAVAEAHVMLRQIIQ